MSQHDSSISSTTPAMPVVSDLFASYSDAHGFWINECSVPTAKNEEEATFHPLPSSLRVDITRELRSAQYSRNKAKDGAKFAQAQKSKRQGRPRRGHLTRRSKGAKRSGKRQPITLDLATDSETDYEQERSGSVFPKHREAVLTPVRTSEDRPISTSISPESQPPTEKTPKGYTPPDAYTTATLPESTLDIPAPDIAREFRSYERHRHQTKKNARFTQSRQKKGTRVELVRSRGSKSVKTKNLQSLVALTIIEGETTSEDEIQTPIEVSLSLVLPDDESPDFRAPPAIDLETLITTAKVKYTKEPGFEYVKSVRPVVALDDDYDAPGDDDNEPWEHIWNYDLAN
ncbi:hypothetical protein BDM02DRAFT_3127947 [Thelephora ganbajun]|uniref:Uncharacterized protein n=1 Tax=Thelephora ganbajun TaxID=370292 RepID=A0ACB6ZL71_THEGA|nr:hypothetical protein BDM02DRAFT_3127947 [Thelephora ganbajun]